MGIFFPSNNSICLFNFYLIFYLKTISWIWYHMSRGYANMNIMLHYWKDCQLFDEYLYFRLTKEFNEACIRKRIPGINLKMMVLYLIKILPNAHKLFFFVWNLLFSHIDAILLSKWCWWNKSRSIINNILVNYTISRVGE